MIDCMSNYEKCDKLQLVCEWLFGGTSGFVFKLFFYKELLIIF